MRTMAAATTVTINFLLWFMVLLSLAKFHRVFSPATTLTLTVFKSVVPRSKQKGSGFSRYPSDRSDPSCYCKLEASGKRQAEGAGLRQRQMITQCARRITARGPLRRQYGVVIKHVLNPGRHTIAIIHPAAA